MLSTSLKFVFVLVAFVCFTLDVLSFLNLCSHLLCSRGLRCSHAHAHTNIDIYTCTHIYTHISTQKNKSDFKHTHMHVRGTHAHINTHLLTSSHLTSHKATLKFVAWNVCGIVSNQKTPKTLNPLNNQQADTAERSIAKTAEHKLKSPQCPQISSSPHSQRIHLLLTSPPVLLMSRLLLN